MTSFCEARLRVVYGEGKEKQEATDHDVLSLFYEDSDYSYETIMGFIVSRYDLTGAAINLLGLYANGSGVGEFTPMPTHPMKPICDGPVIRGWVEDRGREQEPKLYKPEEICGIMRHDPLGYRLWVSALGAANREYKIDLERQSLSFEVLRNRKLPAAIIQAIKGDPAGAAMVQKSNRDKLSQSLNAATVSYTHLTLPTILLV